MNVYQGVCNGMKIKELIINEDQNSHHNDDRYKYKKLKRYLSVSKFEFEVEREQIIEMMQENNLVSLEIHFGGESSYPLDLNNLKYFNFLKSLSISGGDYSNYEMLEGLTNLESLFLFNDDYNKVKLNLSQLCNLKSLTIKHKLNNIHGFNKLENLETLYLENYKPKSKSLIDLSGLTNLNYLYLYKSNIITMLGIETIKELQYLGLEDCRGLTEIEELKFCKDLKMVSFMGCKYIFDFSVLGTLTHVEDLRMFNCKEVDSVEFLNGMTSLEVINLYSTTIVNDDITLLQNIKYPLFDRKKSYYERESNMLYENIINEIESGMLEYLEDVGECNYNKKDINTLKELSASFNNKSVTSELEMLQSIKEYVQSLNELNEKCSYELIETDQREQIVDMILESSKAKGYEFDYDITEKYREW